MAGAKPCKPGSLVTALSTNGKTVHHISADKIQVPCYCPDFGVFQELDIFLFISSHDSLLVCVLDEGASLWTLKPFIVTGAALVATLRS
jgi:hypothetical protein